MSNPVPDKAPCRYCAKIVVLSDFAKAAIATCQAELARLERKPLALYERACCSNCYVAHHRPQITAEVMSEWGEMVERRRTAHDRARVEREDDDDLA